MSLISKDLTIIGSGLRIISKGSLVIEGNVSGDVLGDDIQIGEEAVVEGLINARIVTVDGKVSGTIRAVNVALNQTANVNAEINHNSLTVESGATFEGKSRLSEKESDLLPDLERPAE